MSGGGGGGGGGGGDGGGFAKPKREDITKVPGRSSGVTAGDIASGDIGKMSPGKVDIMQTYDTGVAFADKRAACVRSPDASGCFMAPDQRTNFIIVLMDHIQTAQTNYKLALVELKVEKLVEKDDDLNWMVGLLLDLATYHLSSAFSAALKGLKGKPVPDPDDFGLGLDVIPQDLPTWREHAHDALQRVSEKSIDSATKIGFDSAKKKVQKVGKQIQNDKADGAKAATMSYIDRLQLECDLGFERFKQNLLATASDAELVVVNRGFAPEYQSQGQYKAALAAKLARFKQSGVPEIGTQADGAGMFTAHSRRCAWLLDENGNKALWYITVQSGLNMNPWLYGRDLNIEKVPDEFVEAARAKSEEKWGETPTFEHPAVGLMRRMGLHEGGKQAAQRADAVAASEPSRSSLPRLDLGKSQPPSTKLQR